MCSSIALGLVALILVPGPATGSPEARGKVELSRLESAWNGAHMRGDADARDRLCG